MPYNEQLAQRITNLLTKQKGVVEKKMFGGIAYMLKDKMMIGIAKERLMVRCLPERYEELLQKPYAGVMDFTGKVMKGFLYVNEAGYRTDKQLQSWLDVGIEYAMKSPPKKPKAEKPNAKEKSSK